MSFHSLLRKVKNYPIQLAVFAGYLLTHLVQLTTLPVFADEAIYIRWSQLIMDDWQRYLFFSLNDGKTPLFIWGMIPFLISFIDQLFAGRLLTVLVGMAQVVLIGKLTQLLGGNKKAQILSMVFTSVLPFWFFYHRIALMDGLMTFFLSLTFFILIKLSLHLERHKTLPHTLIFTLTSGLAFGLALLSKIPALFFSPVFVLIAMYPISHKRWKIEFDKIFWIGLSGAIGIALFLMLKLHPAFGQLFSRGNDFTYSIKDLLGGDWQNSLRNIPRFFSWLLFYLTPVVCLTPSFGLFVPPWRKKISLLLLSATIFIAPFAIFGRTVYPRYLLPSSIFLTVGSSVLLGSWLEKQKGTQLLTMVLIASSLIWSGYSMIATLFFNDQTPYVAIDVEQYQTEWSAGYGIKEAADFIESQAQKGRVVVATEGYFGTLPDGILMNLHNQDVSNIEVFGIGQPIKTIPAEFLRKASDADFAYIMVNSHRMFVTDDRLQLVHQYKRPKAGPTFDIYQFQIQ